MILLVVIFSVPADAKTVMGGEAGNIGSEGSPIFGGPFAGAGPE